MPGRRRNSASSRRNLDLGFDKLGSFRECVEILHQSSDGRSTFNLSAPL